jgi:hypothetical protein
LAFLLCALAYNQFLNLLIIEMLRRKVIDHILFNDELELLKIRMKILAPVVDLFIIYESYLTFTGKAKSIHATLNRSSFPDVPYLIKVDRFWDPLNSEGGVSSKNPWRNEQRQRDEMTKNIYRGQINIMSDVDEIPSREIIELVKYLPDSQFPITNFQTQYYYDTYTRFFQPVGNSIFALDDKQSATRLRKRRNKLNKIYGGWHFSCFGGQQMLENKLRSFSHQELEWNSGTLADALQQGKDFVTDRKRDNLIPLTSNKDIPSYVLDNLTGEYAKRPDRLERISMLL